MGDTAKEQCLARWPSLNLTCRFQRGRFRVSTGTMPVASGKTAHSAWANALQALDAETTEMYRDAYNRTLEKFGRGIQSAAEGIRP